MRSPAVLNEKGFTLVELIYVTGILSILASITLSAFYVYREDVEYAKAVQDLRNARTALEVGDLEAESGASLGLTYSGTDGGDVSGAMGDIMPGAVTSPDVRLGVQYQYCEDVTSMDMNRLIISQPCKGDRYTSYMRLCNGVEVLQGDLAFDPEC